MPNIKLADSTRNARLSAILTDIGASGAVLKLRDGTMPVNCAAADAGTALVTISPLPNPWLGTPATGAVAIAGAPWTAAAGANGTATHFRIYAGGTTCKLQGSVSVSGGGGDMIVDNATVASGQTVNVTTFTLTDANG